MDERNRPPSPAPRSQTTPFGDEFVRRSPTDATRPLKGQPTQNLQQEVQSKTGAVRQDLEYVRHLTTLFAPSIAVLRAGLKLTELPATPLEPKLPATLIGKPCQACGQALEEAAEAGACEDCGALYHARCWAGSCTTIPAGEAADTTEPPVPCGQSAFAIVPLVPPPDPAAGLLANLSAEGAAMARAIAGALGSDPKVKQRAQVCIYQYEEAYRAYQTGDSELREAERVPPQRAWSALEAIGIERIKGKAYAICGFYENFKDQPVLSNLFPPPRPQEVAPPAVPRPGPAKTQPLSQTVQQPARPSRDISQRDPGPPALEATGGLLGKLRNLFKT